MPSQHDPYRAWRIPIYRRYFAGHLFSAIGLQMQMTAIGWEIYERTHRDLSVGLVGLAQFLPALALFLWAGHVADRYPRRIVGSCAAIAIGVMSLALATVSWTQTDHRWIYVCLMLTGAARAFLQPAKSSLLPQVVPAECFANAVTWNTTAFQIAAVSGPALAGYLVAYLHSTTLVYVLDALAQLGLAVVLLSMPRAQLSAAARSESWHDIAAGVQFLWRKPILLGAIGLDMFAVLFGGAVAMLPAYAKDILRVGEVGFGWLNSAPAVGALLMAAIMAHLPPMRRAGWVLLASVVGFGVATIIFGLTASYPLALVMLGLTGAFDNISVVIRHTLLQTQTPNALRGRVSSVNSIFIGASNELGRFESGLVADWLGPVFSVVSGGVGTLMVVFLAGWKFPDLRNLQRFDGELEKDVETKDTLRRE